MDIFRKYAGPPCLMMLSIACVPKLALAKAAPAATPATDAAFAPSEIVLTAQKCEQNVQKVIHDVREAIALPYQNLSRVW